MREKSSRDLLDKPAVYLRILRHASDGARDDRIREGNRPGRRRANATQVRGRGRNPGAAAPYGPRADRQAAGTKIRHRLRSAPEKSACHAQPPPAGQDAQEKIPGQDARPLRIPIRIPTWNAVAGKPSRHTGWAPCDKNRSRRPGEAGIARSDPRPSGSSGRQEERPNRVPPV